MMEIAAAGTGLLVVVLDESLQQEMLSTIVITIRIFIITAIANKLLPLKIRMRTILITSTQ